ncbi:MAG: sodium:calcium antiporter [Candidatus Aenigmarchaeota archaeon]|nr:sodium:calcium antiporter [Candidatus Aenigmarchaeota archaeon]
MMIFFYIFMLFLSFFFIAIASDKIIVYTTKLSYYYGLSQMSAGFIVLSVVTSLPELFVSVFAAISGEGGISVGNVLGSNVANLTIIIGLAILLSGMKFSLKSTSQAELAQFLFVLSLIPLFILERGSLGPVMGVVLLILFVIFSLNISKKAGKIKSLGFMRTTEVKSVTIKFLLSIAVLLFFSKIVVDNSIKIAEVVGLAPSIIGATLVAIGTSIPELATTIQALKRHYFDMAFGNILGSCTANITLILGMTSLISMSEVSAIATSGMMFFVLASTLSVWYFVNTSKYLGKKTAIMLIMIYVLFVLQQIGVSILNF